MKIWLSDEKTGIECGKNKQGELFLGDDKSGYNLPDTPENRDKIINDFCRQTKRGKEKVIRDQIIKLRRYRAEAHKIIEECDMLLEKFKKELFKEELVRIARS